MGNGRVKAGCPPIGAGSVGLAKIRFGRCMTGLQLDWASILRVISSVRRSSNQQSSCSLLRGSALKHHNRRAAAHPSCEFAGRW
jgi:hypothetical protein